ncbi:MAG: hypothetical protein AAGA66_15450, partial [Bacteroidota bacterium]
LFFFSKCALPSLREAVFEKEINAIESDVKSIQNAQEVKISWGVSIINGNEQHVLSVSLINCSDLPTASNELASISKDILHAVTRSLKNKSDYTTFEVKYVNASEKGIIQSSDQLKYLFTPEELGISSDIHQNTDETPSHGARL